jgi:cytochrome c oxidase assembly protein subunit 11
MTVTPDHKSNTKIAVICGGVVFGMVGMAYAAVPLYAIFCQVTGFGGTTQRAEGPASAVIERKIAVEFDANVNRDLDWSFKPVQHRVEMKIGEEAIAFYRARNTSDRTVTGTAVFNVTPPLAGKYFNKIECFCFTEQTLRPGQVVDMPVTFYVDPEIVNDKDLQKLKTITLSYTFYEAEKDETELSQVKTPVPNVSAVN